MDIVPLNKDLEAQLTMNLEYLVLQPLVLLSIAFQLILFFLSNLRRGIKSRFLDAIIWSAYMTTDALPMLALGVISSYLSQSLRGDFQPRLQVVTFWAPSLLLHLGGPDTITAFELQDNELWKRHLLGLGVRTVLTVYILYRAWTLSVLSALYPMMLAAATIKYAERTWSLWSASSDRRRRMAERVLLQSYKKPEDYITSVISRTINLNDEIKLVSFATTMFRDTECMFADALVNRDVKGFKKIVEERSPDEVMRLIEMELKMIYDNLYTKASVIVYPWVFFRFISFLLTCITLILFCLPQGRLQQFSSPFAYPLAISMLAVSISLDLCAAFIFLTSYGMISWFGEIGMGWVARCMMKLAVLRTRDWSNSMGQFSEIRYLMRYKLKWRQLIMRVIFFWRSSLPLHVYHRGVAGELKRFILDFLKQISEGYNPREELSLLESRGRKPWRLYKESVSGGRTEPIKAQLENVSPIFEEEFGQTIIFLHLVTEICYYMDAPFVSRKFEGIVPTINVIQYDEEVFQKSTVSKHLSRYLMHLFVDRSDLLPLRSHLSRRFFEEVSPEWGSFFNQYRNKDVGKVKDEKKNRRADKVQACREFWKTTAFLEKPEGIIALRVAHNLLKALRPEQPLCICPSQAKERWEMLNEVWTELLVFAAVQCGAAAHAQHLRDGGELLTHVWVLLGHFGFLDEALRPLDNVINIARSLS